VTPELDSLEAAISGSGLDDAEKEIMLHRRGTLQGRRTTK
jgi:hypothetical protein